MFRLVEVAGELYVPPTPPARERNLGFKTPPASARPLPYTGLHMAVGHQPSTVIVSDLLSHVLPADFDAPVMLLSSTTGDYAAMSIDHGHSSDARLGDHPTINLSDFEEVRDLAAEETEYATEYAEEQAEEMAQPEEVQHREPRYAPPVEMPAVLG
jgi:hypothetical protein